MQIKETEKDESKEEPNDNVTYKIIEKVIKADANRAKELTDANSRDSTGRRPQRSRSARDNDWPFCCERARGPPTSQRRGQAPRETEWAAAREGTAAKKREAIQTPC